MAFDNEQAWMINPRRKKRAHKKGIKTMAKRRQPAGLKKYWASRKKKTTTRKRRRSTAKRATTRKRRGNVVMPNPRRRHRRGGAAVGRSHRRGYRRNPGVSSFIPSTGFLKEIAFVGAGYYGTRIAYNFVGPMIGIGGDLPRLAIKSVVAFGVSYVGGMLFGSSVRNSLLLGGSFEVFQDAVKTYVSPFVPMLAAADMQDVSAYFQPSVGDEQAGAYYQGVNGAELPSDNYQ